MIKGRNEWYDCEWSEIIITSIVEDLGVGVFGTPTEFWIVCGGRGGGHLSLTLSPFTSLHFPG